MYNTIILKKGEAFLSRNEFKKFEKGDTIWGNGSNPVELIRWNIEREREAKEKLEEYSCEYRENIETWDVEEYALEYCECGEDGEFIEGSDFDLAGEAVWNVD